MSIRVVEDRNGNWVECYGNLEISEDGVLHCDDAIAHVDLTVEVRFNGDEFKSRLKSRAPLVIQNPLVVIAGLVFPLRFHGGSFGD